VLWSASAALPQLILTDRLTCRLGATQTLVYTGTRCGPSKQHVLWRSAVDTKAGCRFVPARGNSSAAALLEQQHVWHLRAQPGASVIPINSTVPGAGHLTCQM